MYFDAFLTIQWEGSKVDDRFGAAIEHLLFGGGIDKMIEGYRALSACKVIGVVQGWNPQKIFLPSRYCFVSKVITPGCWKIC